MRADTVQLFLAILAVACQLFLLCAAVFWVGGRLSQRLRVGLTALRSALAPQARALAALVATTAMLGSLYFSEVVGYVPCRLCWYQRAAMYPLAVVLIVAVIARTDRLRPVAFALCAIGAPISVYHYQLERFPQQHALACSLEIPCNVTWFLELGYISLPLLALTAFATVATLLALQRSAEHAHTSATTGREGR